MEQSLKGKKRRKSEVLAYLKQEIQGLEVYKQPLTGCIETGIREIDLSLPGSSFPLAAIHEFIADNAEDGAAASGFLSGLLSGIANKDGYVVWIVKSLNVFPPSLKFFGLNPDRIIFIELPREKEALWAMEDALRCKGLAAVVCEVTDPDLTATRRMQIAVEKSGVTGFLLRMNPKKTGSTACVTRWHVKPLPSVLADGLPGVGFPRWQIELLKVRNGRPGSWPVEWRAGQFHLIKSNVQTEWQRPTLAAVRA